MTFIIYLSVSIMALFMSSQGILAKQNIPEDCIQSNFSGKAYDLKSNQWVYTEQHRKIYHTSTAANIELKPIRHHVTYLTPENTIIATKSLHYGTSPSRPEFDFTDQRIGYVEGAAEVKNQVSITAQKLGKKIKSKTIPLATAGVHDAGFHEFIVENWATLISGNALEFDFLTPSRFRYLDFTMTPNGQTPEGHFIFLLTADNPLFNFAVKPIELIYSAPNQELINTDLINTELTHAEITRKATSTLPTLLSFQGLTNIKSPEKKQYRARIEYAYSSDAVTPCPPDDDAAEPARF